MIPLKDSIRAELAGRFNVKSDDLVYLAGGRGDSDGIVFTYAKDGRKYVMKIAALKTEESFSNAREKLAFANYLGENGVTVGAPLTNKSGNAFETLTEGGVIYLASVMDFIEGICPSTDQLTAEVLYNWGKLTGKMHAATKKYHVWSKLPNAKCSFGHEGEIAFFRNWCPEQFVKDKWLEIMKEMAEFPKDRTCYGFIHNDNHQRNIIVNGEKTTVIDFDCAECNFLVQDVFLPVQGLLFDVTGGFDRPIADFDPIKRFYESFLKGYETENHIGDEWLKRLKTFLDYRRLLLFTVMEDWMQADKAAHDRFMSMIENPCDFSVV